MSNSKTHWKKLQNPDYFGAWSIPEGQDLILTVSFVKTEEVTGAGGRKEQLPVLHFKEKGVKPLILNVTNSRTIESIHGSPYIEDWSGKQIQVYQDTTKFAGEEVECVRIRSLVPNAQKPAFTPDDENWNTAVENIFKGKGSIDGIKKHYELSPEHEEMILFQVNELKEGELENA